MRISSILLIIASLELSRYPGRASRVIPKSSQSANFLLRLNRRQRTILRHVSPSGFAQTRTLASAANSTQVVIDRYHLNLLPADEKSPDFSLDASHNDITALYKLNDRICLLRSRSLESRRSISIDPPPTEVGQMEFAFFVDES